MNLRPAKTLHKNTCYCMGSKKRKKRQKKGRHPHGFRGYFAPAPTSRSPSPSIITHSSSSAVDSVPFDVSGHVELMSPSAASDVPSPTFAEPPSPCSTVWSPSSPPPPPPASDADSIEHALSTSSARSSPAREEPQPLDLSTGNCATPQRTEKASVCPWAPSRPKAKAKLVNRRCNTMSNIDCVTRTIKKTNLDFALNLQLPASSPIILARRHSETSWHGSEKEMATPVQLERR